jgi:GTP-binding protein
LYPHLGVVRLGTDESFVIADIPGLIEGAAEGAGLGIRFLKHLARTHILLHLLDIFADGNDVSVAIDRLRAVENELNSYSDELYQRERWLVLNKVDLLSADQADELCTRITTDTDWQGPVFRISALSGTGCQALVQALHRRLAELHEANTTSQATHVPPPY